MTVIYTQKDRVKLTLGEVEFHLKPLSYHEKQTVIGMLTKAQSIPDTGDVALKMKLLSDASLHSLKCSLKLIKGIKTSEGDYELSFDENDILTEECVSDLMNFELSGKMIQCSMKLLDTVPKDFGVEGVSFVKAQVSKSKKKQ